MRYRVPLVDQGDKMYLKVLVQKTIRTEFTSPFKGPLSAQVQPVSRLSVLCLCSLTGIYSEIIFRHPGENEDV